MRGILVWQVWHRPSAGGSIHAAAVFADRWQGQELASVSSTDGKKFIARMFLKTKEEAKVDSKVVREKIGKKFDAFREVTSAKQFVEQVLTKPAKNELRFHWVLTQELGLGKASEPGSVANFVARLLGTYLINAKGSSILYKPQHRKKWMVHIGSDIETANPELYRLSEKRKLRLPWSSKGRQSNFNLVWQRPRRPNLCLCSLV